MRVYGGNTGAIASLVQLANSRAQVQPYDIQARGVTGTQLDTLSEQEVKFNLRGDDGFMTFVRTFVVSPFKCAVALAFSVWISCSGWELESV